MPSNMQYWLYREAARELLHEVFRRRAPAPPVSKGSSLPRERPLNDETTMLEPQEDLGEPIENDLESTLSVER